jgi:hypothetical protein
VDQGACVLLSPFCKEQESPEEKQESRAGLWNHCDSHNSGAPSVDRLDDLSTAAIDHPCDESFESYQLLSSGSS